MGELSPFHLLFVLVIALIVIGPGKLPEVGAALGKTIREFRKASADMREPVSTAVGPSASASVVAPVETGASPASTADVPAAPPASPVSPGA